MTFEASLHEFAARDVCRQRLQRADGVGLIKAIDVSARIGTRDRFLPDATSHSV